MTAVWFPSSRVGVVRCPDRRSTYGIEGRAVIRKAMFSAELFRKREIPADVCIPMFECQLFFQLNIQPRGESSPDALRMVHEEPPNQIGAVPERHIIPRA